MLKLEKTNEVLNNKQNPVKRIIKKANKNTEGWISKYSLTYNKGFSKIHFLQLLKINTLRNGGDRLRKWCSSYKEWPVFCLVHETEGEAITKSWAVKAAEKRSGGEMSGQSPWMRLQKLDAKCCSRAKSWSTFVEGFIDISLVPQAKWNIGQLCLCQSETNTLQFWTIYGLPSSVYSKKKLYNHTAKLNKNRTTT